MFQRQIALAFLLVLFSCGRAFADTKITAEVDRLKLSTNQALTYKVQVESTEPQVPSPVLPDLSAFAVVSQSQSSSVSLQGGGLSSNISYLLVLLPKQAGTFEITPATIKLKGQTYASQGFRIEVEQGQPLPKPAPQQPKDAALPPSNQPQVTL